MGLARAGRDRESESALLAGMENPYLFVYGLLRPEFANPMSTRLTQRADLIGEATVQGRLFDVGHYPALILDRGATIGVRGQVYRFRSPDEDWSAFDDFEDVRDQQGEYVRVVSSATLADGQRIAVWVYEFNRPTESLSLIECADYYQFLRKYNPERIQSFSRKTPSDLNT